MMSESVAADTMAAAPSTRTVSRLMLLENPLPVTMIRSPAWMVSGKSDATASEPGV